MARYIDAYREKQIEEMAKVIDKSHWKLEQDFTGCHINSSEIAEVLYNAGYRKIQTTDWLTKGISKEQLEREREESLKEFFERNCKK